ncbi:hypothetical protein CC80DRAFT_545579 [Byssothecium circinans]|uniref:Uncharacterized protein n=1 Tax=Byssothecium circinans TaxID=147558 RepID=A0A6A5U5R9_9PLEO|nr:hypothetical protein CC80DRAFT_545579 [Byssothecium circinans]
MAKNTDNATVGAKVVPADCVSVLLMAIGSTSISKAQYDMMSALDGTRTASSFEHQFRSITAKAKDLKTRVDSGETFVPVAPSKKRGAIDNTLTPPITPKKPKLTPKPRAKKSKVMDRVESQSPSNDVGNFVKQEKIEVDNEAF